MENIQLRVGLITYPDTLFPITSTLLELESLKISYSVYASDDEISSDVNLKCCFVYHLHFFSIKRKYAHYLNQVFDLKSELLNLLRSLLRILMYKSVRINLKRAIARCRNISKNHIDAWTDSAFQENGFLMVLEDDAEVNNFERGLKSVSMILQHFPASTRTRVFLDLSDSYSLSDLGIEELVDYTIFDEISSNEVVILKKPATNTLCAVLFSAEILKDILVYMNDIGYKHAYSGVPIDWILNGWMSRELQDIGPMLAIHVKPGLFSQLSMK